MTYNEILMVAGMALVTFAMRYPVLALVSKLTLPSTLTAALKFVPPAVLTAIIVPALLAPKEQRINFSSGDADATIGALGISSLEVTSRDDASDSLESIDDAINKVNNYRASMGSLQNRLHSAASNLGIHIENVSDARSRIADTDIAEEASKLARSSILQAAGVSVLAQANSSSANAIKLL